MIIKKILCFVFVFCAALHCTSAYTATGVSTLDMETQQRIWNNISVRKVSAPAANISIDCFDVREDGWIALGFDGLELQKINVYDETGVFQYGYTFEPNGGFELKWNGRNLVIYRYRSDYAVEFDEEVKLMEVRDEKQDPMPSSLVWTDFLLTKKTVNGVRYELRSWLPLTPNYPQAVIIDQDGKEKIIYDNSFGYNVVFLLIVICFAAWLVVFSRMLIRTYREYNRQHGG